MNTQPFSPPLITPAQATVGAIVTNVDLNHLDAAAWRAIEAAFLQHAVLIFPGQHLTDEEQTRFALRFGEIEPIMGYDAVPIANRGRDGGVMSVEEHNMRVLIGNEHWHTDSSFMAVSAKASVLTAHQLPKEGAQTEWADMRAAYDALDDATRSRVDGLSAYHSLYYSQAQLGHDAKPGASYGLHEGPTPLRPLVKTHPQTGRKALFMGRHAHAISGLSDDESRQLIQDLTDFACQPPRTYMHHWTVGDVAVWDNRCLLHRAMPYDRAQLRIMVHARVAGDLVTELAQNA